MVNFFISVHSLDYVSVRPTSTLKVTVTFTLQTSGAIMGSSKAHVLLIIIMKSFETYALDTFDLKSFFWFRYAAVLTPW